MDFVEKGITAIIGSGGKTTLMYYLARTLSIKHKVIISTTTKIYEPDYNNPKAFGYFPNSDFMTLFENSITLTSPTKEDIKKQLYTSNLICIGEKSENGKLKVPNLNFCKITDIADFVILECDGSKGFPLKAHKNYEPVIPKGTNKTIQVLGIKGIGKRINDACHRADIYAKICGKTTDDIVTPEDAAKVVLEETFCDVLIINQIENDFEMDAAKEIASYMNIPAYGGEIGKGELICLQ